MQEVASAYYKVFKYNETFFDTLVQGAKKYINKDKLAPTSEKELNKWLGHFKHLNERLPMKLKDVEWPNRKHHNDEYQERVKDMSSEGEYNANFLGTDIKI